MKDDSTDNNTNSTLKLLKQRPEFLLCPYCTRQIPSISFKSSNGTINLNCSCTLEPKDLSLSDYMTSLQQSIPKHSQCIDHYKPQEKYCMDCAKWLCIDCLKTHAYLTRNHTCLIDYQITIRCETHKKAYAFYCKQCSKNICFLCKNDHYGHQLIDIKPIHISQYQSENDTLNKIILNNKEKANRLTMEIDTQINELTKEIAALSRFKEEISELIKTNETLVNQLIDYIDCLCTTSLALGDFSCYQLMNNFSMLAIPNNATLYEDISNSNSDADIRSENNIEDSFNQLKALLLNPFIVKYQCKATLRGHTAYIDHLIKAADKDLLVSSSGDKTIKFWDVKTHKCEVSLQGHNGFIYQMLQLSNGQIASRSDDTVIKLWSTQLLICIGVLEGHTDYIHHLIELTNSQLASCSSDKTIRLWNVSTKQCIGILEGHLSHVREVIQLSEGIIASRSDDKTIRIWSIDSFKCNSVLEDRPDYIREMVASAFNDQIAFRSDDNNIQIWNYASLQLEPQLIGHSDQIEQLLMLSDGQLASLSRDKTIRLWNMRECKCDGVLKGHSGYIRRIMQLSDGQLLSYSDDMTIKLWNVTNMRCIGTLKGHTQPISKVVILNEYQIASCSEDYTVRLWSIPPRVNNAIDKGGDMRIMATEVNAKKTITTMSMSVSMVESRIKAMTRSVDAQEGDKEHIIKSNATLNGHTGVVYDIIQISDNQLASCSSDTTIKIWYI